MLLAVWAALIAVPIKAQVLWQRNGDQGTNNLIPSLAHLVCLSRGPAYLRVSESKRNTPSHKPARCALIYLCGSPLITGIGGANDGWYFEDLDLSQHSGRLLGLNIAHRQEGGNKYVGQPVGDFFKLPPRARLFVLFALPAPHNPPSVEIPELTISPPTQCTANMNN